MIGGEMGSGKSTFAHFLSENLNDSCIIEGDYFMKLSFHEKEKELLTAFGSLKYSKDGHIKARSFYSCQEDFERALTIICPHIHEQLCEEIKRNQSHYYIIIEWSHIHILHLWNSADYKFFILADDEKKINRLLKRDEDNKLGQSQNNKNRITKKILAGKISDIDYDTDVVTNNGSIDNLRQIAKTYAKEIEKRRKDASSN